jgi:cullin 3
VHQWIPAKTWKILEDAIHEIHNQNASGLSFEELYRYVLGRAQSPSRYHAGLDAAVIVEATDIRV